MASISAAHPTLPIPSYARVTNLANQKSIIVRVNDRGPYHADRLIDVSVRTAQLLGFYDRGVTRVRVEYVGRAALDGSDDTKLAATLRERHAGARALRGQGRVVAAVPAAIAGAGARRGADAGRPSVRTRPRRDDLAASPSGSRRGAVAAISRQPIAPSPPSPERLQAMRVQSEARRQASVQRRRARMQWERGFASRFAPANSLPAAPAGPTGAGLGLCRLPRPQMAPS